MTEPQRIPPNVEKLARTAPRLQCPSCGEFESYVVRAMPDNQGVTLARIRACMWCAFRFRTEEVIVDRRRKPRNRR